MLMNFGVASGRFWVDHTLNRPAYRFKGIGWWHQEEAFCIAYLVIMRWLYFATEPVQTEEYFNWFGECSHAFPF
ncbi:hypothetical protein IMY05_005G0125700 [Salix suchowensis]|nr:hypothetical protein IMY05_005G0125700 [Salix suchowensis]